MEQGVSEKLRTSVWNELYENKRVSRYYQEVLKQHKLFDWILRCATTLVAIAITFVPITDYLTTELKVGVGLLFLILYGVETMRKSVKVKVLTQARKGCIAIDSMWKELWREIESGSVDEETVRLKFSQIVKVRDTIVTSAIVDTQLTENRKLNIKCAREAKENMIHLYEGASA